MKIAKKTNKTAIIIISSLVLGAIIVAALLYIFVFSKNTPSSSDITAPITEITEDQVPASDNNDTDQPSKLDSPDKAIDDKKQDTSTPSEAPEKPMITRATQSGGTIKVVAILQDPSSGYCELQLSRSGQTTITKDSSVVLGPSYYTCSMTLTTAEIGSSGTWNVSVIHHIGTAKTASDSQTIEVQ